MGLSSSEDRMIDRSLSLSNTISVCDKRSDGRSDLS